jgi:uncharacterized protein YjbI with pentapeptide repeats
MKAESGKPRIDWRGAKMQGVDADLADFRGADLRQVNLRGAYLQGAIMPAPTADVGKEGFAEMLDAHARAGDKSTNREREMER